ncbi:hypothetical protein DFJ74DRAFT_681079 [Hyaloraphidium curvatum]|nr:hypothetical protein DFJ74DRAFT_681079 [Hyaloraphidium curvatum]
MPSSTTRVAVVGAGQFTNRSRRCDDSALEPVALMEVAVRRAFEDASGGDAALAAHLRALVDAVTVISFSSWTYDDAPSLVASRCGLVGVAPQNRIYSESGGTSPLKSIDAAARRIAAGEIRLALIVGAEAWASRSAFGSSDPPWTLSTKKAAASGSLQQTLEVFSDGSEYLARHQVVQPMHAFSLYENALRKARGMSKSAADEENGELMKEYSTVAAQNAEYAWFPDRRTREQICTVSPQNRMVSYPWPVLMNSIMAVNQAACVLVASTDLLSSLGSPLARPIFIAGAAGTADSDDILERRDYHSSPGAGLAMKTAMEIAGVSTAAELDYIDLYSCFPSSPKLAAQALGIPVLNPSRPRTVTGGLASFGGPGSNYSMHAVCFMVQRLREQSASSSGTSGHNSRGLVYSPGDWVRKHQAMVFSTAIPPRPYPPAPPLPPKLNLEHPPLRDHLAPGESQTATIETFSVLFDRASVPTIGFAILRLATGERTLANCAGGSATAAWLIDPATEPIGATVKVWTDGSPGKETNWFEMAGSKPNL